MMTTKTEPEEEDYIPLTDEPLFPDWDEPMDAYPEEEEDEQDIE
jgi:hypothetical protein